MSKISSLFKYFNNLNHTNKYKQYKNNLGFSLLELSIVIIIIGILIIGVIRGYNLITASKIITLTNELTQYALATEEFINQYGNLPGIIENPEEILGNTAKSKIDEDKIDVSAINESGSVTNAESINFFNHLYLSGLLEKNSGPFVGTNNNLGSRNEITKDSNYYPTLQSIKSMFIYVRGDDVNGNYNKTNRLSVSSYTNDKLGINADLIFGLDNKVDDGLPLSGLISIIPMKVSNYNNTNTSSNYNNDGNIQMTFVNNIIDYYLSSSKSINSFNIINTANAEDSDNYSISCLLLDKSSNEIIYNTKGKNCFILRSIDSEINNKFTDLAIKDTVGESCRLTDMDGYDNTESVAGITILNGSKKTIRCNDGYTGSITLTCNEGRVIYSGDAQCTFTGCKKYDNNIINNSLNAILTTNDIVNWDNVNEEDKTNLLNNNDVGYGKNSIIATLGCKTKEGYNLKEGSNGYTIKCDGYNNIVAESNGGCKYKIGDGCVGFPEIDKLSTFDNNSIAVHKRIGCTITQNASNVIYNDTTFTSSNAGYYTSEYLKNKRFINSTIIDTGCQPGYYEIDSCKDDSINDLNKCVGGTDSACWYLHYYECKNNQWVARGKCQPKTCSIEKLKTNILGNDFVKTITQCNDESCSTTNTNEIIDITTEVGKSKIFDYNTYITINTCDTGYSTPNKRIIRCNENGEWEVIEKTKGNMCIFTGCNDMSAVFDKNGQKVSKYLYDMTFGSNNNSTDIYTIAYCHNNSLDASSYTALSTNNNFIVNNGTIATCGDNTEVVLYDTTNENRHYTCTLDTENINEGKSYWKTKTASCDLNKIKNAIGYTAYLKTGSSNVPLNSKDTQFRYLNSIYWNWLYTDQTSNFALSCNSDGNWVMEKTANSCQGLPTKVTGSEFWPSDTDIMYVGESGMLMNKSTLSKDTSTLTKTMLSTTGTYFVTNGTKIEASCNSDYREVDKNNLVSGSTGYDAGGHYYECVSGTWTAMGKCQPKTCSVEKLTTDILGNDFVKTIAWCTDINCNTIKTDSVIDITLESNKNITYNEGTIIAINTCKTGYYVPENKRMIRCNENGEWGIYNNTGDNMCTSVSICNDMSAVFDKNNNKVSDQLYDMTFGSDNSSTSVYPLLYCHNNNLSDNSYTALSKSNNFTVEASNGNNIATVTCADSVNSALDTTNENRHYTCTLDTENINEGKSYWKTKTASCDLNTIKNITNKGYTAYLSNTYSSNLVTLNNKGTQHRYLSTAYWSRLYTDQTSNFTLSCNSNGNWVMEKTDNSCQGLPTKVTGSEFWPSDTDIRYVGESGMLMNKYTLSKDTSTLTKDMLSETGIYFVTNGTKVDATCNSKFQEMDDNNFADYGYYWFRDGCCGVQETAGGGTAFTKCDFNNCSNVTVQSDPAKHYYECKNGSWIVRGKCGCLVNNLIIRDFKVEGEDNCDWNHYQICSVMISGDGISQGNEWFSLLIGQEIKVECDTGDSTKKSSLLCTTYHRRVSGYVKLNCTDIGLKVSSDYTTQCIKSDDKYCNYGEFVNDGD